MQKVSKGEEMFKSNLNTLPTPRVVFKIGIVLAATLICSCSNNLSRHKAADLISQQLKLPATQTVVLASYFKKSWSDPASGPFGISAACLVSGDGKNYSDMKQILAGLESKGLISIGERKDHEGECNYLYATTNLTEEGKKYLVKESDGIHVVKAYDLAFGEVTGIQINEQFKTATADYTLTKINITPFASNISTEPINGKATFALFDDGWRIK
jgi:hypothetical protein